MGKCPPGVICIENFTVFFLIMIVFIVCFLIYIDSRSRTHSMANDSRVHEQTNRVHVVASQPQPSIQMVPINVPTRAGSMDTSYRQVGFITPLNEPSQDNILTLMGRSLHANRNKWQYYTITNQHNNVRLPISFKGRSASNDYGVDEIFSGDTIYVEGHNNAYTVTIYENGSNNGLQYLPFL